MTAVAERQQLLGSVLCQCQDASVELLCTRCLARSSVPASVDALEHEADRFLVEHRHAHYVPDHHWHDDGSASVQAHVGVVCDGSPRQVDATRTLIDVARGTGHEVRIVHPEESSWATVPGDGATTLDAGRFQRRRRAAVLALADEAADVAHVDVRAESTLGAALELAGADDIAVLVVLQPRITGRLLRRIVERRVRLDGRTPPRVLVLGGGPASKAALQAALDGASAQPSAPLSR